MCFNAVGVPAVAETGKGAAVAGVAGNATEADEDTTDADGNLTATDGNMTDLDGNATTTERASSLSSEDSGVFDDAQTDTTGFSSPRWG